jgi:hypothetical protein
MIKELVRPTTNFNMMVSKVEDVLDLKTGSGKLKVEELATFQHLCTSQLLQYNTNEFENQMMKLGEPTADKEERSI